MSHLSPRATLVLLICLAAALAVAGVALARREQSMHLTRDREPLRRFADEFQHELHRLERLYESHLTRIARTAPLDDKLALWRVCDRIVGIRQFSFVRPGADGAADLHLAIEPPNAAPWPEPAFSETSDGLPRPRVLLERAPLLKGSDDSGWVDEPGKPLMFWLRRTPDACVVLLIDEAAVATAIDGWFSSWVHQPFEAVRVSGGPDQLQSPSGQTLARIGVSNAAAAEFPLPLRTRFGAWQLASWDHRETRVSYSTPIVAGGAAVAVLVGIIGVIVFVQQQRTMRVAAERVSFVNAVSHELRAPLTNILLNLELAADALDEATPEPARRLALVEEEARRLGRLIDNVLTFSRRGQDAAKLTPHACVPASVVRGVVAQFAPSFARHALEVRCLGEVEEPCLLDADALAQILGNLLSNVEKYVPGGPVEIASRLGVGLLTITVADHGPGIPAREAERIFEPFERLDSRVNRGASGTGLGLAIARNLATQMGGSLRLVPSQRGASFELRIPAPAATAPRSVSAA